MSIFSLWFVILVLKIPFYSKKKDISLYYHLKTQTILPPTLRHLIPKTEFYTVYGLGIQFLYM